jgi:hypothetical protein
MVKENKYYSSRFFILYFPLRFVEGFFIIVILSINLQNVSGSFELPRVLLHQYRLAQDRPVADCC